MRGTVYDTLGRRVGKSADLEALFVDQAVRQRQVEECFVVVGPDSSEGFKSRLTAAGLSVVVDDGCVGAALIISGFSAEWPTIKEES